MVLLKLIYLLYKLSLFLGFVSTVIVQFFAKNCCFLCKKFLATIRIPCYNKSKKQARMITMEYSQIANFAKKIKDNISQVIIGKDHEIELVLTALLAGGHILLEDVPGTGKTTMAKALSKSLQCGFPGCSLPRIFCRRISPVHGSTISTRGALPL